MTDTPKDELSEIRKIERAEAFKAFVESPFFKGEFLPLIERHFAMWLDAVMNKKVPPDVLDVFRQLMNDIDGRIDIGKRASERLLRRRYGALAKVD
jgi:hypothetical protein